MSFEFDSTTHEVVSIMAIRSILEQLNDPTINENTRNELLMNLERIISQANINFSNQILSC